MTKKSAEPGQTRQCLLRVVFDDLAVGQNAEPQRMVGFHRGPPKRYAAQPCKRPCKDQPVRYPHPTDAVQGEMSDT